MTNAVPKCRFPSFFHLDIGMGKRQRDENMAEVPLDGGTGPLLFYTANKDGASASGHLLNDKDRNGERSVLSNFAKTPVEITIDEGVVAYKTVEHAFQSMKYRAIADVLSKDFNDTTPTEDRQLAQAYRDYAFVIGKATTANRAFMLASMRLKLNQTGPNFSTADRTFNTSDDKTAMQVAFDAGVRSPSFGLLTSAQRIEIMDSILLDKFEQNKSALAYLMTTRGRILIEHTGRDAFWGDGGSGLDTADNNHLGKALMRIRSKYRMIQG